MKKIVLSTVLLSLVTSCATYKSGKTQAITVKSTPSGADCNVSNSVSNATVRTPGVVEVGRSMSSLKVECSLMGYGNGDGKLNYGVNWWAAGNVITLGLGYFYDVYTGSVAQYPKEINVELKPVSRTYEGNFQMRDYNSSAVVPQQINTPQVQNMNYQPNNYQPANYDDGYGGSTGYAAQPVSVQQLPAQQQPAQQQMVIPQPGAPLTEQQKLIMQQQMMQQQQMQQQMIQQQQMQQQIQPQQPYVQPQQVQQPQTQQPTQWRPVQPPQTQSQEQIIEEMKRERQQMLQGGQ